MKLWLTSDNVDWEAGRFRYPAEQMLFTLFPGERAEYPDSPAPTSLTAEDNAVIFTLHRGAKLTNMSALVLRGGRWHNGVVRFPSGELDAPPEAVYHTVSHALKQAFYKAGTALLGHTLPWGSLTGVRPVKLPTRALLAGKTPKQAQGELEKVYGVSPAKAALAVECARAAVRVKEGLRSDELSLYIGIPFCPSRCAYCSFISADVKRALALVEPYLDGLCAEISAAGEALRAAGAFVRCLYIGGGTPTTLSPAQLERLLGQIKEKLDLSRCTEYTVEAGRPDTITAEKLAVLKAFGVSRVSVNPQTMSDQVLAAIGRCHTAGQTLDACELVKQAGFTQVNMDLIAGLPADTPAGFSRTLERVLALEPENITVHTLALKKSAALFQNRERLPGAEAVAEMLEYADRALRGAGYVPYYLYRQKYMAGSFENVGWCKPGAENGYNICMMEELRPVLALGAGGVSKLTDGGSALTRLCNPKYPAEYLERLERILAGKRTAGEYLAERIPQSRLAP